MLVMAFALHLQPTKRVATVCIITQYHVTRFLKSTLQFVNVPNKHLNVPKFDYITHEDRLPSAMHPPAGNLDPNHDPDRSFGIEQPHHKLKLSESLILPHPPLTDDSPDTQNRVPKDVIDLIVKSVLDRYSVHDDDIAVSLDHHKTSPDSPVEVSDDDFEPSERFEHGIGGEIGKEISLVSSV